MADLAQQDDPTDWSVDRVIREICRHPLPEWADDDLKPLLDQSAIQDTLQSNLIDGDTLLDLDDTTMREDLYITAYGERRRLRLIIDRLRQRSQKRQWSSVSDLKPPQTSNRGRNHSSFTSVPPTTQSSSTNIHLERLAHRPPQTPPVHSIEQHISPASRLKKEHEPKSTLLNELETHVDEELDNTSAMTQSSATDRHAALVSHHTEVGRRKRRRLAPDLVSPQPRVDSRELNDPFVKLTETQPSTNVSIHDLSSNRVSEIVSSTDHDRSLNVRIDQKDSRMQALLDNRLAESQHQFYGAAPGSDVNSNSRWPSCRSSSLDHSPSAHVFLNFSFARMHSVSRPEASYQRITARRNNFLGIAQPKNDGAGSLVKTMGSGRQRRHRIKKAVIMTNDKLVPWSPSTRSQEWKEYRAELSKTRIDGFEKILAQFSEHDIDDDDDEILPLYGESDEEERYVTEGSIESDTEILQSRPVETTGLTKEQVNCIIDETIAEFREAFVTRRLAKVKRRAYSIWMLTSRISSMKIQKIEKWQKDLEHFSGKLADFREGFLQSRWDDAAKVKKQCDSLSATVDLIEETKYLIQTLQNDQEPTCPPAEPRKRKRKRSSRDTQPDDEITCDSDDDASMDVFQINSRIDKGAATTMLLSSQADIDIQSSLQSTGRFNDDQNDRTLNQLSNGPSLLSDGHGDDMIMDTDDQNVSKVRHDLAKKIGEHVPQTPIRRESLGDRFEDADDERDAGVPMTPSKRTGSARKRLLESKRRNPLQLPNFTDFSEDASDTESDIDRPSRMPATRFSRGGRSSEQPIDLTLSSPSLHPTIDSEFEVRTPELNPVTIKYGSRDQIKGKGRAVDSEPEGLKLEAPSLPDIYDTRRMKWKMIDDSHTALAKNVYTLPMADAKHVLDYSKSLNYRDAFEDVLKYVINMFCKEDDGPIPHVLQRDQVVAVLMTNLFLTYSCLCTMDEVEELPEEDLNEAWNATATATSKFRPQLIRLLQYYLQHYSEPKSVHRLHNSSSQVTEDETGLESSTGLETDTGARDRHVLKLRKGKERVSKIRKVPDNARDAQRLGQKRMEEQERRKAALASRAPAAEFSGDSPRIPVNFTEPIVYLDQHIANLVKPHQIEGIQFMWREIVGDPKGEGCLLAHTMGLGKTMQVISVLVTIAQCLKSSDPKVVGHIPERLRQLRILVVAPAGLVNNWYDELLLWMPAGDSLGPITKINARNTDQYYSLKSWAETGGVVVMSYHRVVQYASFKIRKNGYDGDIHDKMRDWLFNSPTIVVADEAHMLKSNTSQTNAQMSKLKTRSRIALTGSPLSNHLEEYWAIINFIAPNYLGDMKGFKNKFIQPIITSLAADSSGYQQRVGLKKLHTLKRILGPKVHRADIGCIRKDMPPKTEFFITVPLTDLQKKAYQHCVTNFRSLAAKWNGKKGGNILTWIALLSLLIYHPSIFARKHEIAQNDPGQANIRAMDEAEVPEDINVSEEASLLEVMSQAVEMFTNHEAPIDVDDPSLSHRALITLKIVQKTMRRGEKLLLFSHSLLTLDYLGSLLDGINCKFQRIDGATSQVDKRQQQAKDFNAGVDGAMVFLVSTRAGGLGLNLQGATRVIIFDYSWSPSWEQQAVGRAYRLGQTKPVFVYRFRTGGTYEDITFNAAVFKTQMFSRVVDHKTYLRKGTTQKSAADKYLFDPKDVHQQDFDESLGKDSEVLDHILKEVDCVRGIDLTETFAQDINEGLTEQEMQEANYEAEMERLEREDPAEFRRRMHAMEIDRTLRLQTASLMDRGQVYPQPPPTRVSTILQTFRQPVPVAPDTARQGTVNEVHRKNAYASMHGQRTGFDDNSPLHKKVSGRSIDGGGKDLKSAAERARISLTNGPDEGDESSKDAPGCKTQ